MLKKRNLVEIDINVAGQEPERVTGNAMLMSILDEEKIGTVVVGKIKDHDTRVKLLASSVAGILQTIPDSDEYMAVIVNGVIEGFKSHAKNHGASDEDMQRLEEVLLDIFDMHETEAPDQTTH